MPEQEWFTVVEVAKMLKVGRDTITRRFENEPGVIDLGTPSLSNLSTTSGHSNFRPCLASLRRRQVAYADAERLNPIGQCEILQLDVSISSLPDNV